MSAFVLTASAANAGTTTAINTTGCALIILLVVEDSSAQGVHDSAGNTWIGLTGQLGSVNNNNTWTRLYYCINPTTSAAHTFTAAVTYGSIVASAWTVAGTPSFDQQNGAGNLSGMSAQAGSVTPGTNGELIIFGVGNGNNNSSYAINDSFSIIGFVPGSGTAYGAMAAYLIQATAAPINPTGSWVGSSSAAAVIATFKAVSASTLSRRNISARTGSRSKRPILGGL